MGTIAEKLTYLDETREKIKNAINITGAEITESDTFRSYSEKLSNSLVNIINNGTDELYENFPKISNSEASEDIELTPTYEAKMEIELHPQTKQNSTSGKNLLDIASNYSFTGAQNIISIIGKIPAGRYLISCGEVIKGSTNYPSLAINNVFRPLTPNLSNIIITIPSEISMAYLYSNGGSYNASIGITSTIKNLMISSEGGDYEPYTNGPSPNPEYPQEIYGTTGETVIDTHDSDLNEENQYKINLGNSLITMYEGDNFVKQNNIWYIERNNGKIDSYNGETITTSYLSTTGQLTIGATVVYKLANPVYEQITDTNLISQLEAVYNMKSYDGTTYITSSNSSSLPFKIKASALKKAN